MTTPTTADRVSEAAAKALRDAMERLLAGRPTCTDGRLIKENLYREAKVSRATMNRAHSILAEWDRRTAATDARTPGEARRDDELQQLKRELKQLKHERTELQHRLDGAVSVIAALHHDNTALRQELHTQTGTVVAIGPQRSG
ncbi:hypothetical protein ACFVT9_29620 [Kitasatospora cineracea]|uniref:hypothetical protein n=1 Tax=Kitasatospora cineracea TaxID=88074 RepID=UPI0036DE94BF